MALPIIDYNLFVNHYFYNIADARLRLLTFEAYRNLVQGIPLSSMYTGTTYTRVRNALTSVNFITRSNDYVPFPPRIRVPRIFPNGDYYEFDIYFAEPYEEQNKEYTVQAHFNVWLPFGSFLLDKPDQVLFRLFYPITTFLFARINFGASIEAMVESQEIPVVIGISKHVKSITHNVDTWSIMITKVESSRVNSYVYDFVVRYQWVFNDLGGGTYDIDMCHLRILDAISCRTQRKLYDLYNEAYVEYTGREKNKEEYYTIFNYCPFNWRLYIPREVPLCNSIVNVRQYV